MAHKTHEADARAEQYLNIERTLAPRARRAQLALLLTCALLLVGLGLALCLTPHEAFSPEENRALATAPSFSWDALADGSLTRALSDFCADQFPLRSQFIQCKAAFELLLGKQQNNGVLLGKDDYLIVRQEYGDEHRKSLEQNLVAVRRMKEALEEIDLPFTFAVVPRSLDVNTQKLPRQYDATVAMSAWSWLAEAANSSDLTVHTLTEPLRAAAQSGEQVWYRTDHHWTSLGAYHAYVALSDELGYAPYPLSDFTEQTVCDDFRGTTHAKAGMQWIEGEALTLLRYEGDEHYLTEIVEGGRVTRTLNGLYDMSAAETHDEYNVFLGGTNAHIRVRDTREDGRPTLLLLKDSFSQSLAPYLARHYDLVLIDPRTHKVAGGSIYDLILSYAPDRVLLLYGIDTLCESPSLNILSFGLNR